MIDPSGLYMSRSEQKNRPKGFITLIFIILMILCGIALTVYSVYIYRVHPELLTGEDPVSSIHKTIQRLLV